MTEWIAAVVIAAYCAAFFLFRHSKPVMRALVAIGMIVFVPLALAVGTWIVDVYFVR